MGRVRRCPSFVYRLPSHMMVGVKQRLGEKVAHVCAAQPVPNVATVAGSFDEAGETELGQVLTCDRWAAAGDRRKGGDVGFTVAERPENSHPRWVREQRERHHGGIDLVGGGAIRMRGRQGLGTCHFRLGHVVQPSGYLPVFTCAHITLGCRHVS